MGVLDRSSFAADHVKGRGASAARTAGALAAVLLTAPVIAGCGTGAEERVAKAADPLELVTVLPTRPGLVASGPPRAIDADGLAEALGGRPDPDLARAMVAQGLERAAMRSWRAPRGGEMRVVTSLWQERLGAVGFGARAAERLLVTPGARPWTPRQFGGSRGARVGGDDPARALSFAVGRTALFVRGDGAVSEEDVLRTMDRLAVSAQGDDI